MKVLVTGATGQLGRDMVRRLRLKKIPCLGAGSETFDLKDREETFSAVRAYRPDAVIHCAAYTAVDKAEEDRELCRAVNADGTRNVAMACREAGAKLLYLSTDYVFGGDGEDPYEADSPRRPLNQYGLTKALGEDAVREILDRYFIIRTSWLFGKGGNNFLETILWLGSRGGQIPVVSEQIGSPTYTADLAELLAAMLFSDRHGIYHAANEGFCSRAEFAREILRQAGFSADVRPIASDEYPTLAKRPLNSRLSKASLDTGGFSRLPPWQDALARCLAADDIRPSL
ncbi:dTDP-4-dehydrorhamnose reductase [Papillibacter cinnamivorans]|uniref:dTDP-4-dehydrorhamnose reductase n=1 Tax=Papillibacter cinnamivorans DSM 12816 TaxID=1122930 RepID=A0A1W2BKV7_9FIRM|nr:dTDP-4-dehydrorhamnose reductase [Papillibacter cinnamivorans]SMC73443.1 dTDP-4-dehydrorhamnose reductase [Papillibacter cinnamivorans DSM 12816]